MDRERIDAFLDRVVEISAASTTLGLLAVADRCGLLSWLGANSEGSAATIADGASLEERYVLEICSGLAAAGILEHADGVFRLPVEHATVLADESSPYFMGGWLDMIPAIYAKIDAVAKAARQGGGVPAEDYGPAMLRGLDRANGPSQRILLTRKWLPGVPGLAGRLESGIRVADVGCGTGTAAIAMATAYPESSIVGFEVFEPALEMARERATDIPNLSFENTPAERIPVDPGFDLITAFDVIHDLADPLGALRRIRDALRPEGMFLMMEPNVSSDGDAGVGDIRALNLGTSVLYCMTQSLAEGGAGLGAAWGPEQALDLAREAGFDTFEVLEALTNRFSAFYLLTA